MTALAPVLTPHGVLTLKPSGEAAALEFARSARIEKSFVRGAGHGLLSLGADEVGTALPPVLSYWREFGSRYVTALCALPGVGEGTGKAGCPGSCGRGIDADGRRRSAHDRRGILDGIRPRRALAAHGRSVRCRTGRSKSPASGIPQAPSSRLEPGRPRAFQSGREPEGRGGAVRFLATYTTRLSAQAKAQHLPLGKALQEYAGAKNASACCRC